MSSALDYQREAVDLRWLDRQGLPTAVMLAYVGRRCDSHAARDHTFDRKRFVTDCFGNED